MIGAVALSLVGGLSACAGDDPQTAAIADVSAEAASGGDLTMLLYVPMRTFDPAEDDTMASTGDGTRMAAIYDYLFTLDPVTGEVVPRIGESLTPNDDGTVWTLKLNDGVKFSDGTDLNADAVKFTWGHIRDKKVARIGTSIAMWKLKVTDPLTLTITLPGPNKQLDKTIASSLPFVISPTAYTKDPKGFSKNPVGAGPFTLGEVVADDHETYKANKNYWKKGLPKLDSVRVDLVADAAQRVNTIASGEADMQAPESGTDLSLLADAGSQGLVADSVTQNGGGWVYFNNTRAPFDDPRARRAVYLALDREKLSQVALGSKDAHAINTLFVKGSPFYEKDLTFPKSDKKEAQKLFDELAADGKPVDFTYVNMAGGVNSRTAQYIQAQLSTFDNVKMKIDTIDVTAAHERVFLQKDYDMSPYPGAYKFPDPEPGLYNLLATDAPFNTTGYSNADVDDALNAARQTTDTTVRKENYRTVQEQFMKDLPGLFTFSSTLSTVMTKDVTGVAFTAGGQLIWDELGFKKK
ncbi:ABC transporter substrate-binding protein [Microbacterium elymi]|uniref:ABC transporter substrate-binding protein n=1 Tax=Microbacterium elymi TaxID=2909587 RepID=A0ABY5NNC9_9MICO|nr:ABC transporter substrate-binding protein [Microbacterium elymi]UUT36662.1 ABC transporter substrate-binding protein [Microbacterium elymi]